MKLGLRARLALSFGGAVAAALVAFSAAVVVVLAVGERDERKGEGAVAVQDLEDAPRVLFAMAVVAPFAIGGAAALGWWLAKKAVQPLLEASARARSARASSFDLTLPLRGNGDEWDELAGTLNALLGDGRASLERIRRFTADAAHELRTPLTAIVGEADVSLRRERGIGELRASLQVVRDEAAGMARVIDALLTLARADAGVLASSRTPCQLGELVQKARLQALDDAARAGIAGATVDCAGAEALVQGDPTLLVRALRNLIDNGLRHGGGSVRVQTTADARQALVRVEDSGEGIPAQLQPVLFHRFARGDPARSAGGIGLGLSLARAIAEAHGGSLQLLESARGAAFLLSLPIA